MTRRDWIDRISRSLPLILLGLSGTAWAQASPMGCFKDASDRDLTGFSVSEGGMTTGRCISICAQRHFKFAATQYGSWCFCGNSVGRYGQATTCDMRCAGNAGEICGGSWANSVYRLGRHGGHAPVAPPPPPPPPSHGGPGHYLGCFKDASDRDLTGFSVSEGAMSTERCLGICREKGFAYAATQYASWCFCGARYGRYGQTTNCDMKCTGNAGETCGGSWANSVYRVGRHGGHAPVASPPPPPPPPPPAHGGRGRYLGCYKDTSNRDLTGFSVSEGGMTTGRCFAICGEKGFAYAATQYSSWCFCGASYGRYGQATNCDMKCAGNAGETCGGSWANSVYAMGRHGAGGHTPVASPPPPPPPEQIGRRHYLGCYRDASDRDLTGFSVSEGAMTTERCLALCRDKGFTYAATQYSSWCFCGASYGRHGQAQNCDMKCTGNAGETCGGSWANSVYRVR